MTASYLFRFILQVNMATGDLGGLGHRVKGQGHAESVEREQGQRQDPA